MDSAFRLGLPRFVTDGRREGMWKLPVVGDVFLTDAELADYKAGGLRVAAVLEPGLEVPGEVRSSDGGQRPAV